MVLQRRFPNSRHQGSSDTTDNKQVSHKHSYYCPGRESFESCMWNHFIYHIIIVNPDVTMVKEQFLAWTSIDLEIIIMNIYRDGVLILAIPWNIGVIDKCIHDFCIQSETFNLLKLHTNLCVNLCIICFVFKCPLWCITLAISVFPLTVQIWQLFNQACKSIDAQWCIFLWFLRSQL